MGRASRGCQAQGAQGVSLLTAIEFLSILAYPESAARRARVEEALRAYYLRCCKDAGTLEQLGKVPPVRQMEGQFRRLKERLRKRLVAANDCVLFDLEITDKDGLVSLNSVTSQHQADRRGMERYKNDWWRPEVMHLAIVLRGISLGWKSSLPFCPEILILTWSEWIDGAIHNARNIAIELSLHNNPALAGFRKTTFLFPDHP
jgi:hypothetical protein